MREQPNLNIYFTSREANFHESHISVLRNGFVKNEIEYRDITKVYFVKGYLLKNRLLVVLLVLGIIYGLFNWLQFGFQSMELHMASTYQILGLFLNKSAIIGIWGPVLLLITCIAVLFKVFEKTVIIKVITAGNNYEFRIKEIKDLTALGQFLTSKRVVAINNLI